MIEDILNKDNFTKEDIISLLNIDVNSKDFFYLIYKANEYARKTFTKGYIFTQIGLNVQPCSGNCKFCSMARDSFSFNNEYVMDRQELVKRLQAVPSFVSDVFLMTTADFDKDLYLEYCKIARDILPITTRLIANFADFDKTYAKKLKQIGVYACYHIRRLKEGVDTDIPIEERENTIDSLISAGLELYYCIEPISKEHTYSEIADEILYAKSKNVDVMAVMKMVDVKNHSYEISLQEVTKIVAVTMLAVKPKRSMNVHEPNQMSLLAGVNQLYAEEGGNPRDTVLDTSYSRGLSAVQARKMLVDSLWKV